MFKPILAATAFVSLVAVQPAGAQAPGGVSLVIRDGLVTLKADQAPVRQILAEWERQGQMKVVGAERITAAPVTITLKDIPEKQALDIVMRGIPGYMAIDRAGAPASASTSRFDRLFVMARAATPVPATAATARSSPSPAQPMIQEQPAAYTPPAYNAAILQPQAGDDDNPQQPDRNDVDQFANQEPPMPEAPVASPYPNAYPGSPYVGGGAGGAAAGPYGGNPTAAAAAGLTSAPPETQFDYANPQKYFEQRRLEQQAATPQPSPFPSAGTGVGVGQTGRPAPITGSPTAPTTLSRPGVAPVPQQTTPAQGEFFNPYNLPADWVPPPPVPDSGTPVEPDRAKYNNPYEQPKPPQE